jgi:hypothetical protein
MKLIFRNLNYYPVLGGLIVLSFFLLTPQFSAYYTSDEGVTILQANHFNFSTDWYYWGQTRLGSLLPLFGYFLHSIFGLPTITSVSVVSHLILFGLFLVYAGFLKNDFSKILLAMVIFMPAMQFVHIARAIQPYPAQLLFIGLVIKSLDKIRCLDFNLTRSFLIYELLLAASSFFSFLSIWMSEYSVLFLIYLYFDFGKAFLSTFLKLQLVHKIYLTLSLVIPAAAFAYCIFLMKTSVDYVIHGFGDIFFMGLANFKETLKIYFGEMLNVFFFDSNPFLSLAVIVCLIYLIYFGKQIFVFSNKYYVLFLLSIFPVITLQWVWANGLSLRYFTPAYFFFWLCVLKSTDFNIEFKPAAKYLVLSVCILQTFELLAFERNPSQYKALTEFNKLGACGIIGSYWNSYNIASANPDSIIASPPHPRSFARNLKIIDPLFQKKNIYLVANGWLDEFPDSIELFDRTLARGRNQEIKIRNLRLTKYEIVPFEFVLNYENMSTLIGKVIVEGKEKFWFSDDAKESYVWYGPYTSLKRGFYEAMFFLEVDTLPHTNENPMAKIDVCAYGGGKIFGEQIITTADRNLHEYKLTFEVKEDTPKMEFRILKYRSASLKINKIVVRRTRYNFTYP